MFLREEESVDTKTIVGCKIHSRPRLDKVVIFVPEGDNIYRLGFAFEQRTYELTVDNIKRIMPYAYYTEIISEERSWVEVGR